MRIMAVHKDEMIKVRVTAKQKRALIAAAERDGLDEVSTWLRSLGLRRASATAPDGDS